MHDIVTNDRKMKEVLQQARTISQSRATILIQGEKGVGKEAVAQFIHQNSNRQNRPFVLLNCEALPGSVIQSEIFGVEKNVQPNIPLGKLGKLETSVGGTLVLKEVGMLDQESQSKLLSMLRTGQFTKIGGTRPQNLEVRIVATTTQNLADEVKNGNFIEDLYYRLNVVVLSVPTLRERVGDIRPLSARYMTSFAIKHHKAIGSITDAALQILESYSWPGNIRELESTVERAVVNCKDGMITDRDIFIERRGQAQVGVPVYSQVMMSPDGMVTPDYRDHSRNQDYHVSEQGHSYQTRTANQSHLNVSNGLGGFSNSYTPPLVQETMQGLYQNKNSSYGIRNVPPVPAIPDAEKVNWTPGRTLTDIERSVILEALQYHSGNRTHTAKSLGISIRTLRNKLAEYRILGIRV